MNTIINGTPVNGTPVSSPSRRRLRRWVVPAAVVALLLAVLALSVRYGGGGGTTDTDDRNQQGAREAAQQYAQLLGSKRAFNDAARDDLLSEMVSPDKLTAVRTKMRSSYHSLNNRLGLDSSGRPPAGMTLVSRTMPAGTTTLDYDDQAAKIDVWASGLFGLTGKGDDEVPVSTEWFTMTMHLEWNSERSRWMLTQFDQSSGPDPADADHKRLDSGT